MILKEIDTRVSTIARQVISLCDLEELSDVDRIPHLYRVIANYWVVTQGSKSKVGYIDTIQEAVLYALESIERIERELGKYNNYVPLDPIYKDLEKCMELEKHRDFHAYLSMYTLEQNRLYLNTFLHRVYAYLTHIRKERMVEGFKNMEYDDTRKYVSLDDERLSMSEREDIGRKSYQSIQSFILENPEKREKTEEYIRALCRLLKSTEEKGREIPAHEMMSGLLGGLKQQYDSLLAFCTEVKDTETGESYYKLKGGLNPTQKAQYTRAETNFAMLSNYVKKSVFNGNSDYRDFALISRALQQGKNEELHKQGKGITQKEYNDLMLQARLRNAADDVVCLYDGIGLTSSDWLKLVLEYYVASMKARKDTTGKAKKALKQVHDTVAQVCLTEDAAKTKKRQELIKLFVTYLNKSTTNQDREDRLSVIKLLLDKAEKEQGCN